MENPVDEEVGSIPSSPVCATSDPCTTNVITDLPTGEDFAASGITFLNLSWDVLMGMDLAKEGGVPPNDTNAPEVSDDDPDWEAVKQKYQRRFDLAVDRVGQRELGTAISLAQQGVEFLLKGRIAAVTPYLLILGSPGEWPKGCNKRDTPFSEFRTIDAQDLIRVHDSVAAVRLPDSFRVLFDAMRRQRNSLAHTVDRRLRIVARNVVVAVLEFSEYLCGEGCWISLRHGYLNERPEPQYAMNELLNDLHNASAVLTPAELLRFFGIKERQRRYFCPRCEDACDHHWEVASGFARLEPNGPTSTNLHCPVCQADVAVVRRGCVIDGCKGNVIDPETDTCLTCRCEQKRQ